MIGQTIGNYKISALIGEGGMGRVFVAEHPGLGRKAAFKVLHKNLATEPEVVSRFFNEARAANAVRHSAIVDIYDYGNLPDGSPYIVMEFLEGETLSARIARGGMTVGEGVEYAAQISSGLAAAHAAGVVHRDLKPDNIFLASVKEDPTRHTVKILDFGIAKLQKTFTGEDSQTRTGALMGTPTYMSPEQCRGLREVDFRSDIYSLGVITYELLTGTPPFVSPGVGELINLHINATPRPPRELNPALSVELESLVLRTLQKSPEHRFASMLNLHDALRAESAALGSRTDRGDTLRGTPPVPRASTTGPMVARPTTLSGADGHRGTPMPPPPAGARRPVAWLVAIPVVCAIGVVGFLLRRSPNAPPPVVSTPPVAVIPARVVVRFESTPPGASVHLGDLVIATTPGRAEVPAGGEALEFRFALGGHADTTVKAVAGEGLVLNAELKPIVPEAPKGIVPVVPPTRATRPPRPSKRPPAVKKIEPDVNDIKVER